MRFASQYRSNHLKVAWSYSRTTTAGLDFIVIGYREVLINTPDTYKTKLQLDKDVGGGAWTAAGGRRPTRARGPATTRTTVWTTAWTTVLGLGDAEDLLVVKNWILQLGTMPPHTPAAARPYMDPPTPAPLKKHWNNPCHQQVFY